MSEHTTQRSGDALDIEHVQDFVQGTGGSTALYRNKDTKELVVVKIINNQKTEDGIIILPDEVRTLVDTLQSVCHPNINRILRYEPLAGSTKVFFDYCDGGDLLDYSGALYNHQRHRPTPTILLLHFAASMADALAFLHLSMPPHGILSSYGAHPPVIHADIKLNNIFLKFSDNNKAGLPTFVLGDFGLATTQEESLGFGGTEGYMAPELERLMRLKDTDLEAFERAKTEKHITTACDMYAVGVCIYRLATKIWRRGGSDAKTVPRDRDLTFHINASSVGGPELAELMTAMRGCLEHDPTCRMNALALYDAAPGFKQDVQQRIDNGEALPDRNELPNMKP